jgi:type IV pilus assembly protein PilE
MRTRPVPAVGGGGFSLLELMITIVIVAILASVAVPSYLDYVARGKRAAARAGLLEAASFLERSFTTNGCYNRTTVATCQSQTGATLALPAGLTRAPSDGRASHAITVDFSASATGQAYTLTATPCAAAGTCPAGSDAFTDARCGALTLTQAGVRGRTGSADLALCWQR